LQAIILCAGRGTRLGTITESQHKATLKIGKQSIIQRQIEFLYKLNIFDISVITGYKSKQIENELPSNVNFIENKFFNSTGTLYSLFCAKELLNQETLYIHGDLIFDFELLKNLCENNQSDILLAVDPSDSQIINTNQQNEPIKNVDADYFCYTDFNKIGLYIGMGKYSKKGSLILQKAIDKFKIHNDSFEDVSEILRYISSSNQIVYPNFVTDFDWFNVNNKDELIKARLKFGQGNIFN